MDNFRWRAEDVAVEFVYTNWRGETFVRRAAPITLTWKATKHHPEPQWILRAFDMDKREPRDFALKDCDFRALKETPR